MHSHKKWKTETTRVQNVALRGAAKESPQQPRSTNENLHHRHKLEPINIQIHNQAAKTWNRVEILNEDLIRESNDLSNSGQYRDHTWWPTIGKYMSRVIPAPFYKA